MRAQRPGESALDAAGGSVDVDRLRSLATRFGRETSDVVGLLLRSAPLE
jgi:hypothetical protein